MENWVEIVVPIVVLVASVVNAFTEHYSHHGGVARALLAAVERLSFLSSNGVSGKLKLPLTSKPPVYRE